MTEEELTHAYRNTPPAVPERTERCMCGGRIVAPIHDEERIRIAVQGHQQTWRHKSWWGRQP